LEHCQLVDDVPVLGQLAVLDPVDVDTGDGVRVAGWQHAEEVAHVPAAVSSANDHSVAFGDNVFDGEGGCQAFDENSYAVLQAVAALALVRQRVVFV
jgi:hypothetical protein